MNRAERALLISATALALLLALSPFPARAGESPSAADLPAAAEAAPESPGTLSVTVSEAVLLALENNRAVLVQRLNPAISRTYEDQEQAVFDPVISAGAAVSGFREADRSGVISKGSGPEARVSVEKKLETGATVSAGASSRLTTGEDLPDQYVSRVGVEADQPLLRGRGSEVNLARLRQARLDTSFSQYEFRGFAEALVALVENTYWDLVLAKKKVAIVEESLALAQQQLDETRYRIKVGKLAEVEIAAAEAEVALRREALINARSLARSLTVRSLRLIRPRDLSLPDREIVTLSEPGADQPELEPVEYYVETALATRPDVSQAKVLLQREDLELVKTKNGLLPRMDLFVSLGKTGYADSFGGSMSDITGSGYDAAAGLSFEYPAGNRDAQARRQRSWLTREQRRQALGNVKDLARQDVELAYIEVERTRQLVSATAITERFQEETLRAETAKFRVGKSTGLLVAQAQRDLLASQVAQVEAMTTFLKARTNLFLMDGSLLARRGLLTPDEKHGKPAP
ncbi:MAG: TolC family protein [Thermodesulfobacteriota bacterium]